MTKENEQELSDHAIELSMMLTGDEDYMNKLKSMMDERKEQAA
jgi:hypothetical protein